MSSKVVAIIPAREGSKRLPEKNRKYLCNKPLFEWSVDLALKIFEPYDKIILSTNDQIILDMCETSWKYFQDDRFHYIKRPKEISKDNSPIWETIHHLYMKNHVDWDDIIILLQPTSPLRKSIDLKVAIHIYYCFLKGVIPITKIDDMTYKRCGTVFVDNVGAIIEHKGIREQHFILIPSERAIDIDTLEDFQEAERLMKKRLEK